MATTPHMSLWVIPGVSLCNSQLALKVFFFFLLGEFDNQVWEWFNSPLTLANLQANSCRKQTNKQAHNSMQHQSETPNKAIRSSTFGFGLANTGDWGEGAVKQTPELCHSLGKVHDSLQLLIFLWGSETCGKTHTQRQISSSCLRILMCSK